MLGLTKTDAVGKKKAYEEKKKKRVNANPEWKNKYGSLLADIQSAYDELEPLGRSRDVFNEVFSKIELFTIIGQLNTLASAQGKNNYDATLKRVKERLEDLYKEYNAEVDEKLFAALMEMFYEDQQRGMIPETLAEIVQNGDHDFSKIAKQVYDNTSLDNGEKTLAAVDKDTKELLENYRKDKATELYAALVTNYSDNVSKKLNEVQNRINQLQRTYVQAQMDVFKEKTFYPDANSTLRVTYGNVKGYNPRDAVKYDYYTYLDGIMEKYKPGDYEFDVPEKIRTLYKNKDFGQYGKNGKMPVCFIAMNHTTGGNSGSPALDAYGNLVGLNFDRAWEGTMSDINYDPSICRNIMVDIRYVLFIVDKYAGAGHLVKEMKLVHPKRK